ncbi:MAG: hypothetical protein KAI81_04310 [Candidatus Marinimicrobia bacterium]|nr:hypothetical protein [Candidatus Neomarinimicrobiota bacterium]
MKRLIVSTSAATDTLTPASGKKIVVTGLIFGSICVPSALTSTLPAYLCFGSGKGSDSTKCFWCGGLSAKDCHIGNAISNIILEGEIDEIIQLTNITYSVGQASMCATIFYYIE